MTTQYQNDDDKGREIFKKYCQEQPWCKVNKTSKDKFAKWDVSYFSGSTQMIGEIKVRKYDSDTYDWYMQADKLEALRELKGDSNQHITYINHFTDNITLIWDLTDIDEETLTSSMRLLPRNDYNKEDMIWKKVYSLPKHLAQTKDETDSSLSIFKNMNNNNNEEDNFPF